LTIRSIRCWEKWRKNSHRNCQGKPFVHREILRYRSH
jgi:hypothetical protein